MYICIPISLRIRKVLPSHLICHNLMTTRYFAPKISLTVYAIIPFFIGLAIVLVLRNPIDWPAVILLILFSIFICSLIVSTKYAIRGNELGINSLFRWRWFPIDKIESLTETNSILSSPYSLSTHRISIIFFDKKVSKSFIPLEISPKDRDGFINELLKLNPNIKVKLKI